MFLVNGNIYLVNGNIHVLILLYSLPVHFARV